MSQDNICITKTHTYGPPCFLDEDNEPNCSYDITECGMSLADIPRNEETEELFQVASKSGHKEILSQEDIESYVAPELRYLEPSDPRRNQLIAKIQLFEADAESLLEKLRSK